ncbi:MAG: amidohydrolase family protein, partial [Alphaproteobacteria bacterium]|nr:amidohydrolase family protein [Alphaproteobacteria bacterium]
MARQAYRASIFHLLGDPSDDTAAQYFEDGVLVVEDGYVAEIGAWPEIAPKLDGVPVEHFPDGLIVPGFVDSHVHYPQVDIVASRGSQLLEWLSTYTFPTEARF